MDGTIRRKNLADYMRSLLDERRAEPLTLPFPAIATAGAVELKPQRRARRKTRDSLDLFTGAGGLSIGLERAGFRPVLAVEVDRDACETFRGVFPNAQLEPKPIEDYDFRRFEGIDLVAGGPPCQPFSSGGKGLAAKDERDMIPQFIRAVQEARPRAFLMENVSALFGATHRQYLAAVLGQLQALGYSLAADVLNAAEYGVPQKRRRGFVIGVRRGEFRFPRPTHGPRGELPFVATRSVLDGDRLIGAPNESKVFYAKRPDLRPSPYDGQLFNGGGRPIDLNAPCHTILASAGGNKTHFVDTLGLVPDYHAHLMRGGTPRRGALPGARRLTPEESALIQTFPRGMAFSGARSSRYAQIGNAVPPALAAVIGEALADSLR